MTCFLDSATLLRFRFRICEGVARLPQEKPLRCPSFHTKWRCETQVVVTGRFQMWCYKINTTSIHANRGESLNWNDLRCGGSRRRPWAWVRKNNTEAEHKRGDKEQKETPVLIRIHDDLYCVGCDGAEMSSMLLRCERGIIIETFVVEKKSKVRTKTQEN